MSFGSALGQDRWIIEEVFASKRGGYFVEAGALNGVDESNSVRLEREFGWQGLCVEPTTAYFETLKQQRRCRLENVCLYDQATEVDFVEAGGHGGIPSSFSASFGQQGRSIKKPALPLHTLLDRNGAPPVIDYLSLDTEGSEYTILKDFPFDRYRVLALTVEHNNHPPLRDRLRDLLQARGFVLAREVWVDDWWVHHSHFATIDADRRELWRLLNKFPPDHEALRYRETRSRYDDLRAQTNSVPALLGQLSHVLRKRIRGKPA